MLEVKVTLEIPGVPEALNRLADALALRNCGFVSRKATDAINERLTAAMDAAQAPAPVTPAPTPAPVVAQASAPAPVATPEIHPTPAPAPVAPAPTPEIQPTPAPAPAPAAKKYTRDEIAHAGSALVSQGKMQELIALLGKYGVQSVAQLGADKYDAFAADLKALGAAL